MALASVMESVNRRTQLAGTNRLEMLVFSLGSEQLYGINVFKIKELLAESPINSLPGCHKFVRGVTHVRGITIPVYDMQLVLENRRTEDTENAIVVVTEFNQQIQGFFAVKVDRIVNMQWDEIHPPPSGTEGSGYLTAVTKVDDKILEIIDVEKIIDEVSPQSCVVSDDLKSKPKDENTIKKKILVCDDSIVARKQIDSTLRDIDPDLAPILLKNGKEALDFLESWAESHPGHISDKLLFLISDIEMPEMDGYKLTAEIRNNDKLKDLFIILHSSLSGVFNQSLVQSVGADMFIPKYNPDDLAKIVMEKIKPE